MITEDYVSFETAKLLKEKGFDEPCHALYHNGEDKIFFGLDVDSYYNTVLNADCYACPTLQMAMKWLREVHNLHIVVFRYNNSAFPYIWYIFAHNGEKPYKTNSYEEACEEAIKYCLENLI